MTAKEINLADQKCSACEGEVECLAEEEIKDLLAEVDGWDRDGEAIVKSFKAENFHETMAFVNAVAWIAHQQDHHPDLEVSYAECRVRFSTHKVGGLTQNDFICAARVNQLLATG